MNTGADSDGPGKNIWEQEKEQENDSKKERKSWANGTCVLGGSNPGLSLNWNFCLNSMRLLRRAGKTTQQKKKMSKNKKKSMSKKEKMLRHMPSAFPIRTFPIGKAVLEFRETLVYGPQNSPLTQKLGAWCMFYFAVVWLCTKFPQQKFQFLKAAQKDKSNKKYR
ncbi:hypothetical protein FB451DRAFT_1177000 [Mycena latifolia]|nr:hypothetical protein FB451DRAFT_1177000 [Mycena latifolia]